MKKIYVALAAILLISILAACNQDDETKANENEEKITPVETVEATEGDLVIEKSLYGRTAPASTTPVMLQNPGEIDVLEVENGDTVEEDDLIATILTPAGKQHVYADKAGEITNLEADTGSIVSNEEPLAIIADLDKLKLNFSVTANVRDLFKKEDTNTAFINDKEFDAEITSISTMPDDTGLFPVEATIKNKDKKVLPGLVAVMNVPEKRVKDAIILPTAAITNEGGESFIYIIKDNKAIKTDITIKETQSDKTAVEGDVKAGDEVVVNGQLTLTDGSKVNVVKEGNKS